jgi:hypothetical protein
MKFVVPCTGIYAFSVHGVDDFAYIQFEVEGVSVSLNPCGLKGGSSGYSTVLTLDQGVEVTASEAPAAMSNLTFCGALLHRL